jgi:glycosyltransferase involved in cell wall biosynthesis
MLQFGNLTVNPKILIIGPLPPPHHGITISTQKILTSSLAKNFELIHLDTSDHRNMGNIGKLEMVNVLVAFGNVFKLILLCLRSRPELVYLTINRNIAFARDGLFILAAKYTGRAKVVIHLRGAHFREPYGRFPWVARRFVDFCLSRADRAIVLGNCLRYNFEKWFRPDQIDVIPNGTSFPISMTPKTDDVQGKIVIAYLGYLAESKGVVEAVEAVSRVVQAFPSVEFRLAGSWFIQDKCREKCESIIRTNGSQDRIRFIGELKGDAKWEFLSSAEIFLFPSRDEGHPNVVIEAMAAGLPVISTPVGAIAETVIDSVTGFIVPTQDPEALAEKIRLLITDQDLRRKMADAARRRYEEHYTEAISMAGMERCFHRCLG